MSDSNELWSDVRSALHDVNWLRDAISEHAGEQRLLGEMALQTDPNALNEIIEFQERTLELLARLKALLNEIAKRRESAPGESAQPREGDLQDAMRLAALANEVAAQIQWLFDLLARLEAVLAIGSDTLSVEEKARRRSLLERFGAGCAKVKSWIPTLKKFLAKVWQVIARFMTPKEWKLSGELGTGPFGLAKAGIEITFGP